MSSNPFQHLSETEITLPRSKAKVTLRTPTLDESFVLSTTNSLAAEERSQRMKSFVFQLIVSWDATAKDGSSIPLTMENYGFLPASDAVILTTEALKDVMLADEGKGVAAPSA